MNNTFSFRRFGSYFAYDIRRWASSYGPTLLVMSFFPVILYTLILVYSLLFRQMWCAPSETTRIIVGCIVSAVLSLTYPASVYGFVTDKRAGSAFLMLPASRLEKFLSMILNTVVVVPMIFSALYIVLRCHVVLFCPGRAACSGLLCLRERCSNTCEPLLSLFQCGRIHSVFPFGSTFVQEA